MICRDTPTHGWVHGLFDGWVVQWASGWGQVITKYWINLDVIEIIQFCLKIYDLWRHPYPWVDGWVNGWAHVKSLKSNKSWPNQDNSIMDIFDIFWTFYLNHLSPLWGYFSVYEIWGAKYFVHSLCSIQESTRAGIHGTSSRRFSDQVSVTSMPAGCVRSLLATFN